MNKHGITPILTTHKAVVMKACEIANDAGYAIQAFQVIEEYPGLRCHFIMYVPDDPIFLEPAVASVQVVETMGANITGISVEGKDVGMG